MRTLEGLNQISSTVIGKAIEVHKALGCGLLQSAYRDCLCYELKNEGLEVSKERPVGIAYKDLKIETAYRLDLLIENAVVVELKSVEKISDLHRAQVLTYLKHGNYRLGFLINFNSTLLKHGITRILNG